MNGRQNDSLFKVSIIIVVCAYFMLGNAMFGSGISWTPQFNINTFTKTQVEKTRYDLRLTEIDGSTLESYIYFADAGELLSDEDIYDGRSLVNRLGHALYRDDVVVANELRREFEATYFANFQSAEYDVVFIDINPVEKYSLETFTSERIISQFSHPLGDAIAYEIYSTVSVSE